MSVCQCAGENNMVLPPHFTVSFNISRVVLLSSLFLMGDDVDSLFPFSHFAKSNLTFPSWDLFSSVNFFSMKHRCTIFSKLGGVALLSVSMPYSFKSISLRYVLDCLLLEVSPSSLVSFSMFIF